MKQIFSNSADADVPIPSALRGSERNIDRVFLGLQSLCGTTQTIRGATPRAMMWLLSAALILTPVFSVPTYAWAIETKLDYVPAQDTIPVFLPATFPVDWDSTMANILINEINRHSIDDPQWVKNVDLFIDMVQHIESDNRHMAYNPSGAMSYFQFKSESIKTAHLRLMNYMKRHNLGEIPRWSVGLYYNPESIYHVPANKQAVLMIINIIEQDHERETDYFAQFLSGDTRAGVTAYYKYHHTDPDQFTVDRTERLFAYYFE